MHIFVCVCVFLRARMRMCGPLTIGKAHAAVGQECDEVNRLEQLPKRTPEGRDVEGPVCVHHINKTRVLCYVYVMYEPVRRDLDLGFE